uniref:Uncharacterized protein n=1 Tax=Rhizophora mucronata TaxID=61149 RepID=A0A2P2N016_RHIMU
MAAALAYKCLSHHPKPRPTMSGVVKILESLQGFDDVAEPFVYIVPCEEDIDACFGSEEGMKSEGQKDVKEENGRQTHKHGRGRGWRHRIKLPLSLVSYSDSALYDNIENGFSSPQGLAKE